MPLLLHTDSPQNVLKTLNKKAIKVDKATSVSIFAKPFFSCFHAET